MKMVLCWLIGLVLVVLLTVLTKACQYWASDEVRTLDRSIGEEVRITWWDSSFKAEKVCEGTLERAYFRLNDRWSGFFDLCIQVCTRGEDARGQAIQRFGSDRGERTRCSAEAPIL